MGCVYILKNPAMPDLIKIRHTKRTARERATESGFRAVNVVRVQDAMEGSARLESHQGKFGQYGPFVGCQNRYLVHITTTIETSLQNSVSVLSEVNQ